MKLKRFGNVEEFYGRAEAFLVAHEAQNNLILGLLGNLRQAPKRGEGGPYLALVEAEQQVLAVAVRTPPHVLVISATGRPEALDLVAMDALDVYGTLPGVTGPVPASRLLAERWQALTGAPFAKSISLRTYQLERVERPSGVPGCMRRATPADGERIVRWTVAFYMDSFGRPPEVDPERIADNWLTAPSRALYFWDDPGPVAMAGATGPTPNGIRINAVYTPPECRRRGYASALVAALSQAMLDSGRKYCFLFTDLANPTSNHIYQAIGYQPVCDADEYTF
jgi:predicted GNAT family acetyltransferase